MKNLHLTASPENEPRLPGLANYQAGTQIATLRSSTHREVHAKREVKLTCTQRSQTSKLFKQYDMTVPAWLKQSLRLNQRRLRLLNEVFFEAGVDEYYCSHFCDTDGWFWPPHEAWHIINGRSSCK